MAKRLDPDQMFLTHVMSRAITHASIQFRNHPEKDDLTQEVVCYCWKWTRLLTKRGKDVRKFSSKLAHYAVKAVLNGRRFCGKVPAKETLSFHAQAAEGFAVLPIPQYATLNGSIYEDALIDNTQTPVPDQVWFRLDFPRFLFTLTERNRRLAESMATREKTSVLARKFGLTPGRISQLRRDFHREWLCFHGDQACAGSRSEST